MGTPLSANAARAGIAGSPQDNVFVSFWSLGAHPPPMSVHRLELETVGPRGLCPSRPGRGSSPGVHVRLPLVRSRLTPLSRKGAESTRQVLAPLTSTPPACPSGRSPAPRRPPSPREHSWRSWPQCRTREKQQGGTKLGAFPQKQGKTVIRPHCRPSRPLHAGFLAEAIPARMQEETDARLMWRVQDASPLPVTRDRALSSVQPTAPQEGRVETWLLCVHGSCPH